MRLQKELAAARDARSVLTLVRADGDAFDAINTATALHRIALNRTSQTPAALTADADGWLRLCDLLTLHCGAQDAQGVSNQLWGAPPRAHLCPDHAPPPPAYTNLRVSPLRATLEARPRLRGLCRFGASGGGRRCRER